MNSQNKKHARNVPKQVQKKGKNEMGEMPIVFIKDMSEGAREAVRKFNEVSYRVNKIAQAIPAVDNEETKRSMEQEVVEVLKTYAKAVLTAKEVTQDDFEAVN